jgi:hypothetical protein
MGKFADKEYELVACKWEGHLRCIYLNDYRIAGEKPWGGGTTLRAWKITGKDLLAAIPEVATLITERTYYRDMWLAQRVENENFRKQLGLVPVSDEAEAILRSKIPTDDRSKG